MISVVVPSLNEEKNLADTVLTILVAAAESGGIPLDIVLVDDGSSDRTACICNELARTHSCICVISHERNLGVAVSVREALQLAIYPKFISLPGSNDVAKELLKEIFSRSHKSDLVLAYYVNQKNRGRFRQALSFLFGKIYGWTFQVNVRYFTGPALYPTDLLRRMSLRSYGFSIFPEMTLRTILSG